MKWVGRIFGVLLFVPIFYLIAALVGGLIPVNRSWTPPARGIEIFVETNGVHTWIAVPTVTPEMDWRPVVPAAHIRRAVIGPAIIWRSATATANSI